MDEDRFRQRRRTPLFAERHYRRTRCRRVHPHVPSSRTARQDTNCRVPRIFEVVQGQHVFDCGEQTSRTASRISAIAEGGILLRGHFPVRMLGHEKSQVRCEATGTEREQFQRINASDPLQPIDLSEVLCPGRFCQGGDIGPQKRSQAATRFAKGPAPLSLHNQYLLAQGQPSVG
jgi:hypothetical protein